MAKAKTRLRKLEHGCRVLQMVSVNSDTLVHLNLLLTNIFSIAMVVDEDENVSLEMVSAASWYTAALAVAYWSSSCTLGLQGTLR